MYLNSFYKIIKREALLLCAESTCHLCIVKYLWFPSACIRYLKFILEANHCLNALKCPKGEKNIFMKLKESNFRGSGVMFY